MSLRSTIDDECCCLPADRMEERGLCDWCQALDDEEWDVLCRGGRLALDDLRRE